MSPPNARNAPGDGDAPQIDPDRSDGRQTNTGSGPSQYLRVLRVLVADDEVCGHRVFYGELRIPRFSAHLHTAKKAGFVISKRPCDRHDHEGVAYLYRLEALPYVATDEPCPVCGGRRAHVSTCPARDQIGRDPNLDTGGGS